MLAAVLLALGVSANSAAAADQALALKRVLLSTGGVGYFEYEAEVRNDEALSFDVRRDQVDDVLKSVVIYDDKGGVGSISLPGEEPLEELFRELPFKVNDLSSPPALLEALRGAEVEVQGGRELKGRIVAVNREKQLLKGSDATVDRHRLSVMTEDGLQTLILEEADTLKFTNEELDGQIKQALAGIAEHGRRERRRLNVNIAGEGKRKVRLGYVVEAPLWKSTYRLTLQGDPKAETAALQGWAVLENLSGEDWKDVDLTIVSGNPVTFQQALYRAYYVDRPEVPVEVLGRVLPRADEGGIAPEPMPLAAAPMADKMLGMAMPEPNRRRALMAQKSAMPQGYEENAQMVSGFAPMVESDSPTESRVTAAESSEAATQVVFTVPTPITVQNGHSVMVPLVGDDIPATTLSLYQPETHPLHPLASVNLKNDSKIGLPPGVLTLYESQDSAVSFVGDAQLNPLPAGEDRLLSYAVDQRIRIHREQTGQQMITTGKIVNGLLTLTRMDQRISSYRIIGDAKMDREVWIEQPKLGGWSLKDLTPKNETSSHYRFAVSVPAGKTETLKVIQERPRTETLRLTQLDAHRIDIFLKADTLPKAVKDALAKLPERLAALRALEQEQNQLNREQSGIIKDQSRIRNNLDSVPEDSDIYRRYLSKLSDQEDRLETIRDKVEDLAGKLKDSRKDLEDFVQKL